MYHLSATIKKLSASILKHFPWSYRAVLPRKFKMKGWVFWQVLKLFCATTGSASKSRSKIEKSVKSGFLSIPDWCHNAFVTSFCYFLYYDFVTSVTTSTVLSDSNGWFWSFVTSLWICLKNFAILWHQSILATRIYWLQWIFQHFCDITCNFLKKNFGKVWHQSQRLRYLATWMDDFGYV